MYYVQSLLKSESSRVPSPPQLPVLPLYGHTPPSGTPGSCWSFSILFSFWKCHINGSVLYCGGHTLGDPPTCVIPSPEVWTEPVTCFQSIEFGKSDGMSLTAITTLRCIRLIYVKLDAEPDKEFSFKFQWLPGHNYFRVINYFIHSSSPHL